MKKTLFLIILALALWACGGNQPPGGQAERKTLDMPEVAQSDSVAKIITQKLLSEMLSADNYNQIRWPKYDQKKYWYSVDNDLYYINDNLWLVTTNCFEKKDGGYFVLFVKNYGNTFEYDTYDFSGGKLTPTDGSLLPTPSIENFYTNYNDFPASVRRCMEKLIAQNTSYYQKYNDSTVLTVSFSQRPSTGEYPTPLHNYSVFSADEDVFPKLEYKWDGEQFTLLPDPKPWEADLSYFQDSKCKQIFEEKSEYPDMLYFGEHDLLTAKGDLNQDGHDDIVIAESTEAVEGARIVVYLYDNGKYKSYSSSECTGTYHFTGLSISGNGVLRVDVDEDERLIDCLTHTSYVYMFRYQVNKNDDESADKYLYLIGGKADYYMDLGDGEEYVSSYNMLTNQLVCTEEGNGKKNTETLDIPAYPLLHFYDIKFGDSFARYHGCDMMTVWRQFCEMTDLGYDDCAETDPSFEIGNNTIHYELGMYFHRDRTILSFPNGENSYKVFDAYNYMKIYDDQIESENHELNVFDFKDGKLTRTELPKELADLTTNRSSYYIYNDTLCIRTGDEEVKFAWNTDENKMQRVKGK